MLEPDKLRQSFRDLYGREPRLFTAPARVNLIGEHTDYNEGFVLPMAANRRTWVAASPRDDKQIQVHSFDLNESADFFIQFATHTPQESGWVRYIQGVAEVLKDSGCDLNGADLAISSDIPIGAGLSSSAALEISVGYALLKLSEIEVDRLKLVMAAQKAEHEYVGTKSGLMDQLTVTFGSQGHALFIDCRTNELELIPLNIPLAAVVLCDTGVKHELASSEYNQRRRECEEAVQLLRAQKPAIQSLRDVTLDELDLIQELPEPLPRRCRHVVTENHRTLRAARVLQESDVWELGQLMNDSHRSLRDDYEVSCFELDTMVELALQQSYVFGGRMMGGGFGGCTVNLVARDHVDEFTQTISEGYFGTTGISPKIYAVEADNAAAEYD